MATPGPQRHQAISKRNCSFAATSGHWVSGYGPVKMLRHAGHDLILAQFRAYGDRWQRVGAAGTVLNSRVDGLDTTYEATEARGTRKAASSVY